MKEAVDVVVRAEDPAEVSEGTGTPSQLSPADALTDFRQQYEIQKLQEEIRGIAAAVARDADLHSLRKYYSFGLFVLVLVWVLTVWVFLLLQGVGVTPRYPDWAFKLSDPVLIAYITSTTASILGLFGIAAYWLFGKPKVPHSDGKEPSKLQKHRSGNKDRAKSKPLVD